MKSKPVLRIIVIALFLGLCSLATPILFHLLPYPVLDEAKHLEGVIEVKLTHTVGRDRGGQLAKIYVKTANQKVEIDCGYLMDRRPCPDFNKIDGSNGEVWYHRIFGVVQWRLVKDTGESFHLDRSDMELQFKRNFSNAKYLRILFAAIAFLAVAILIVNKK